VFCETRTAEGQADVVYSVTGDSWRVEPHRALMCRTRRATLHQVADARERLADMGQRVTVRQIATPVVEPAPTDPTPQDE